MDNKDIITGLVLRIERASIHDGQGLRTVVFLKGCPLWCRWCSTPESQSPYPELGLVTDRCEECGTCAVVCPKGVHRLGGENDGTRTRIDRTKCQSCFTCVLKCPTGALKKYGTFMTIQETVAEISRDEVFFFHSGGGVTLSGGEPFNQPRFTAAVLKECKRLGIHTAIETCLYAAWESVELVLPWLDMLYVDVKLMDEKLHKEWTGAGNALILENLNRIDKSAYPVDIVVRVPMIPGVTDTDKNLSDTAEYLRTIRKLRGTELLPYHRLGVETYKYLGREYQLKGLTSHGDGGFGR